MRNFTLQRCKLTVLLVIVLYAHPSFSQIGWNRVPSPNPSATRNMVRGISGTSSSDVWAVGSYEEVVSFPPYYIQNDLLLHWNGADWQQFPAMHLSQNLDDLFDVEAISINDVWAAGMYNDPGNTRAELLHYNGTSWSNYALPLISGGSYLNALHAISANDIWAVGGRVGSPTRPAYTLHYNGSSWTEISAPNIGTFRNAFNDVHGTSSNDLWAAGHWGNSVGDYHALMMHWNGSSWTNFTLPNSVVSQLSEILSVKMVSTNDVWAVGYYLAGGMFKLHWDGSTWTDITPTNGGGGAFAVIANNDVYSVGGEISHWDGSTWTVTDPIAGVSYPSLRSTVVFPNGEIWAGGVSNDVSGNFFTLIYRSVNHVPVFNNGSLQSMTVASNTSNNAVNTNLKVTDADVSQVLTYELLTGPAHGSVNGLPASAITNSGTALPSGVSYTPAAGFSGPDQFTVRVSAGTVSTQTTINVNVGVTLPVSLINFDVRKQNNHTVINWSTASEFNSKQFEIERSADGINYTSIATIAARGNSSSSYTYQTTDPAPVKGVNYYRLRLVDLDNKSTVFPVKSLRFDEMMPLQVMGSVINGEVKIQVNEPGEYTLRFINTSGQVMRVQVLDARSPGIYTVHVDWAKGVHFVAVQAKNSLFTYKNSQLKKTR